MDTNAAINPPLAICVNVASNAKTRTMNYKETLLNISMKDLDSSRTLYDSENYPQSVFYIQQSVEKVCKYLALENEVFQPFELSKKMGHDSLKLFRKTLENQIEMMESQLKIYNEFPDSKNTELYKIADPFKHQTDLSEGLDLISKIKDYDLQNISSENLDELLEQLKEVNEIGIEFPQELEKLFQEKFEIVFEWLESFGLTDTNNMAEDLKIKLEDEKFRIFFFNRLKTFLKYLPKYLSSVYSIFILSIIFTMHAISSRYADSDTNFNPLEFYNKENPLIIRMPKFFDYLSLAISNLKTFNNIDFNE